MRLSTTQLCVLLLSSYYPHSHAELWLNDRLYIENNQQLLAHKHTDSPNLNWRLLSEVNFAQAINHSALTLGAKFDFENSQSKNSNDNWVLNDFSLHYSPTFFPPAWQSKLLIILGRQAISYHQNDIFRTSLGKNDDKADALNYSQGLQVIHRLGFIEQRLVLNQYARSDSRVGSAQHHSASTHYQLKVGIPGYIVGPATFTLEHSEEAHAPLRGMLGSAVQFPLRFAPGDWQWAFQYATTLTQALTQGQQDAWQTSLSWLGFIPQHNVGILFSHTDRDWTYSDDFKAGEQQLSVRYHWYVHQDLNFEFALSQKHYATQRLSGLNRPKSDETTPTVSARLAFSF